MRLAWLLGGLTGWTASLALTFGRLHDVALPCFSRSSCERVQQDQWADWFGVPVSAVACVYFLLTLLPSTRRRGGVFVWLVVLAFVISVAYQARSLIFLRASCPWCLGLFVGCSLLALSALHRDGPPEVPRRSSTALVLSGVLLASATLPWSARIQPPYDAKAAAQHLERFPDERLVLFLDQQCPESKRLAALLDSPRIEPKLVTLSGHGEDRAAHAGMHAVDPHLRLAYVRELLESDGRWTSVQGILHDLGVGQGKVDDLIGSTDSTVLRRSREDQELAKAIGLRYVPVGVLRNAGELTALRGAELREHLVSLASR